MSVVVANATCPLSTTVFSINISYISKDATIDSSSFIVYFRLTGFLVSEASTRRHMLKEHQSRKKMVVAAATAIAVISVRVGLPRARRRVATICAHPHVVCIAAYL